MPKLLQLEAGQPTIATFHSGILTGADYARFKVFKRIKVSYLPPIKIDVFVHTIDGQKKLVLSKQLPNDRAEVDLRTRGVVDGYGLSYIITGSGKVFDIVIGVTNEQTD